MDWEITHHLKVTDALVICDRCRRFIWVCGERYWQTEHRKGRHIEKESLCEDCFRARQQDKKNHPAAGTEG